MTTFKTGTLLTFTLLAVLTASCGGDGETMDPGDEPHGEHANPEGSADHGHDEHQDAHPEDSGVVELAPEAVERIGLTTTPAVLRSPDLRRTTTGTIGFDEDRLAHVAPRVPGRLVRVPAELGEAVAAGEVLAVLDSTELGEAKAAFLRARARQEVAHQRFEREQTLYADRISSEQELLDAKAAAREAATDLAAARETLSLLGLGSSEIEGLSWDDPQASLITVRAPFAGKVVAREATLGELMKPEDTLFTIADLSEVWLWVDLYERDIAHVEPGGHASVRLDAWPDETFSGELAYVADELDPESRTVRARVDLPNPEGRLKPGMFARVALTDESDAEAPKVLTVPRTALQRDGNESIVYVRTAPGRFERREVAPGRVADEWVEIVSGLTVGDDVVTEGAFLLRSQASADQLGGHHH